MMSVKNEVKSQNCPSCKRYCPLITLTGDLRTCQYGQCRVKEFHQYDGLDGISYWHKKGPRGWYHGWEMGNS